MEQKKFNIARCYSTWVTMKRILVSYMWTKDLIHEPNYLLSGYMKDFISGWSTDLFTHLLAADPLPTLQSSCPGTSTTWELGLGPGMMTVNNQVACSTILTFFSTHKENYENHDLLGYSKQAFWEIQLPWKLNLWKINKQ